MGRGSIRFFGPVPTIIIPLIFIGVGGIVTAPDQRSRWRVAIAQSLLIVVIWLAIKYL